jgi:hypothetical protein
MLASPSRVLESTLCHANAQQIFSRVPSKEHAPPLWIFSDLSNLMLSTWHDSIEAQQQCTLPYRAMIFLSRPEPDVATSSAGNVAASDVRI